MLSNYYNRLKVSLKGWSIFFYAIVIALGVLYVSNTPYFNLLNNLLLDKFHGQIQPRSEIVIITIDDQSLREIGAWPWDRNIFAQAINNLSILDPGVVGMDILFFENRNGDEALAQAIENSSAPIIIGNKILEDDLVTTIYSATSAKEGFVNYTADTDGVIRRVYFTRKLTGGCVPSLTLQILKGYYREESVPECDGEIKIHRLNADNGARFNYTRTNFIEYSFVDLYNGNLTESMIKDRIVLVGVKTTDVKSEISDNFQDPFGNSVAGIEIHANVLNTFLDQKFQTTPNFTDLFYLYIGFSLLVTFIGFSLLKKVTSRFIFYLFVFVANVITGILYYEFGINWPFVGTGSLIISQYALLIVYDSMIQRTENKIIKKAFKYYVNPDLLRKLMADPASLNLSGEERYMTVLFSDIRGFTSMSEKLEPRKLYTLLNQYLEAMSAIILDYAGTIDKYIGDGIMAFWNAPVNVQFHQQEAVKAAIDMAVKLKEFNKQAGTNLAIGIGIHTGSMLVGNVGGSARFDYTVLGDSVNVASRLEGLTSFYGTEILISKETIDSLAKEWEGIIFRLIDKVSVVGRNEALAIYQPLKDTEENREMKNMYEKGIKLYFSGDFDQAKIIFGQISNDNAARLVVKRMELLGEAPEEWNGVWEWTEKGKKG